jgi:hypothetical protein
MVIYKSTHRNISVIPTSVIRMRKERNEILTENTDSGQEDPTEPVRLSP